RAVVPIPRYLYAADAYGGPSAIPYVDVEAGEEAARGAGESVEALIALVARAGVDAQRLRRAGTARGDDRRGGRRRRRRPDRDVHARADGAGPRAARLGRRQGPPHRSPWRGPDRARCAGRRRSRTDR